MKSDTVPEIHCAISVFFGRNADVSTIVDKLTSIGIQEVKVRWPKYEPVVRIDVAIVHNECFWELDEALTKMFLQVDKSLPELKEIVRTHQGEVLIDVAFYQHGTYPALVFHGESMEKIRFLEANISIDPF